MLTLNIFYVSFYSFFNSVRNNFSMLKLIIRYYEMQFERDLYMDKLELLITKLKDILQINRPELDFGIYRVLNSRAEEIENYLNNKLKVKVIDHAKERLFFF